MQEENKFSYRSLNQSKEKEWHFARGLNDITTAGNYAVRLYHDDLEAIGISTAECDTEHYVVAHLVVIESAATGKQQKMRTVGQTLMFTTCTNQSMKIITRICVLTPDGVVWHPWVDSKAGTDYLPTAQELNTTVGHLDNKFVYKGSGDVDIVSGGYFDKTASSVTLNLNKWGDSTGVNRAQHTIAAATEAMAGVMSAEDKKKLNKAEVVTKVEWGVNSNINDYTSAGVYYITGKRSMSDDGLPIDNYPYFTARLLVFGSTANNNCISQILSLNASGESNLFMRNCVLGDTPVWSKWSILQQNTNVGRVASLDNFTAGGVYSGIYTGGTSHETFVLTVINNEAAATAAGSVRCISQFKYALDLHSNYSYKTRTGRGTEEIEWGDWVEVGAPGTVNIQDGAVTAQKLSSDVKEKIEKVKLLEEKSVKDKNALLNGDTIVGMAREVYSRQGKIDSATFLKRTTAGGTSISDGVASLKRIGGNIVKNYIGEEIKTDGRMTIAKKGNVTNIAVNAPVSASVSNILFAALPINVDHKYYCRCLVNSDYRVAIYVNSGYGSNPVTTPSTQSGWRVISGIVTNPVVEDVYYVNSVSLFLLDYSGTLNIGDNASFANPLLLDLTEMYGVGNEPTKAECDRLFGTMDCLPKGLTVAKPTGFKSIGYNQFNPANLLDGKVVENGAIISGDKKVAVIECMPCMVGVGENNGYCIHGDFDEDVKVYFTPLNPFSSEGDLYMHELLKNEDTGTYIPCTRGYLLVEVPTTDNLCVHLLWSEDRDKHDYEPFVESVISLSEISQMSEWGLAGLQSSGSFAFDTIDPENGVFIKKIGRVDLGSVVWNKTKSVWRVYRSADKVLFTPEVTRLFFTAADYYPDKEVVNVRYDSNSDIATIAVDEKGYIAGEVFTRGDDIEITKWRCECLAMSDGVDKTMSNIVSHKYPTMTIGQTFYGCTLGIGISPSGYISIIDSAFDDMEPADVATALSGVMAYYELAEPIESPVKVHNSYTGSDYGVEQFVGSMVPLNANILFYMRSLVSETRNFLDRLMAGLYISDAVAVADRIVAALQPAVAAE